MGAYKGTPTVEFIGLPSTVAVENVSTGFRNETITYTYKVKSSAATNGTFPVTVRATDSALAHEFPMNITVKPMKLGYSVVSITQAVAPGEAIPFVFRIVNDDPSKPHYEVTTSGEIGEQTVIAEADAPTPIRVTVPTSAVGTELTISIAVRHISAPGAIALRLKVRVTNKPVIFAATPSIDWTRQDPLYLAVNYTPVAGISPPTFTTSTTMPGVDVTFDPDVLGTRGFLRVYLIRKPGSAPVPPGNYTVLLRATSGTQDADATWNVTVR